MLRILPQNRRLPDQVTQTYAGDTHFLQHTIQTPEVDKEMRRHTILASKSRST